MLDIEDFQRVFPQGVTYNESIARKIQEFQHALGGKTFFERLLGLLNIRGSGIYPPKDHRQLADLHKRIISSETSLHNKHCLIFYLLKDLSAQQHGLEELSLARDFARNVHLERRFWTFIDGLWALDHLDFRRAVEFLTHPSIIPTFPDEILYTLLKSAERLGKVGAEKHPRDDILALAYYNCVTPPLDDEKVRIEFARYMAARNVTETYHWIHTRPEYEHKPLLEILMEETLDRTAYSYTHKNESYSREDKAVEFVSLPFIEKEEEFIEKFLTEGRGRTYQGASDTVLMRQIAMGKLVDVAWENSTRGRKHNDVNWDLLKDGVKKGLGPRKDDEVFTV